MQMTTERLVLRPPRLDDLDAWHAIYVDAEEVWYGAPRSSLDENRAKLERQIAALTEGLGQYEKVKKIALLENEMTVEGGELTPTLKVRRRIVDEKYRDVIDRIYTDAEKEKPARH